MNKGSQPISYKIDGLDFSFLKVKIIEKSILKIGVLALIIVLNWNGFSAIGRTLSYFNDTEESSENSYSAGTLDFSLRSGQSNFIPDAENMKPGNSVARDIYIKKEGSLPLKYTAHSELVDGECDLDLYNALTMKIWYNWYDATPTDPNYHEHRHMDLKYNGPLKDFDLRALNPDDPDLQIPNGHPYFENRFYGPDEHWFYATEIILPGDVSPELQNKSCQFKFVFDGWQTDFTTSSGGFSDTESITSTIATGNWMPQVTVSYPNGGEGWWLVPDWCPSVQGCRDFCLANGMNDKCQYPIRWTAINPIGDDMDLSIDIFYSTSSGSTWFSQLATAADNTGTFWWKPPYDEKYASDRARIKVVATNKSYPLLTNWDMSDADFCPPMLTMKDLLDWESEGEDNSFVERELIGGWFSSGSEDIGIGQGDIDQGDVDQGASGQADINSGESGGNEGGNSNGSNGGNGDDNGKGGNNGNRSSGGVSRRLF